MGFHLVFEPDGGSVFCLPAESVPELVCDDTFQNKVEKGMKNKCVLFELDPKVKLITRRNSSTVNKTSNFWQLAGLNCLCGASINVTNIDAGRVISL